WVSDGTAAGTQMVKDIYPGGNSSYPIHITALGNGTALFTANDGTHGFELWVTDGTEGGTSLVKDISAGSSYPGIVNTFVALQGSSDITALGNGQALFSAYDSNYGSSQLWVSDGTEGGTFALTSVVNGIAPIHITALGNGQAVFSALDVLEGGFELWV